MHTKVERKKTGLFFYGVRYKDQGVNKGPAPAGPERHRAEAATCGKCVWYRARFHIFWVLTVAAVYFKKRRTTQINTTMKPKDPITIISFWLLVAKRMLRFWSMMVRSCLMTLSTCSGSRK